MAISKVQKFIAFLEYFLLIFPELVKWSELPNGQFIIGVLGEITSTVIEKCFAKSENQKLKQNIVSCFKSNN
jgi:hypothetical protein